MTPNNNFSVLPFYQGINATVKGRPYQHHRKDYAYGKIYPLVIERNWLHPFQFRVDGGIASMAWALMYSAVNEAAAPIDILALLNAGGMTYIDKGTYYIVKYRGNVALGLASPPEGHYFIEMGLAGNTKTWTSEVFTFMAGAEQNCVLLEWKNEGALSIGSGYEIDYTNSWANRVFLQTQLGKPEYPFEEEVTKRDGYSFIEKQISEKKYRFSIIAPEYLIDAMRLIRLHDYTVIRDQQGRVYDADTFLITPTWQEQGDLAAVEAEFTADTVVKKIAKGVSI